MTACVFASHPWVLYLLAFVGLWHLIGIPPVKDWFDSEGEA